MTAAPELDCQLSPLVRARRWRHEARERHTWPRSAHAGVEVAWVEEGGLTYRVGSRALTVAPGELVIVPAQVEHQTSALGGTRAGSLWIEARMVAALSEAVDGDPAVTLEAQVLPGQGHAPLGRMILEEAGQGGAGAALAGEALAEALLLRALRGLTPAATGARDPRIRRALQRMHEEYGCALSIEDLAATAHMSRFHFSRLFKQELGASPYQYLLQLRVQRAAALLERGGFGVTEAALEVGFTDLARFARAFRATFGRSPNQHRRAHDPQVDAHEARRRRARHQAMVPPCEALPGLSA